MAQLVTYGKVVDDKVEGIYLAGVYFGGVGETHEYAADIARRCVNSIRGGTIIPKILQMESPNSLLDTMAQARRKFEELERRMIEAEDIMGSNIARKK